MPTGIVRAAKSRGGSPPKTFIVWIALRKPHNYLYDRLWMNLNPVKTILFFDEIDQPNETGKTTKKKMSLPPGQYIRYSDNIDSVYFEAFRAATELHVECAITVAEIGEPEEKSIRTGPV
jgi:uncharacterized protein (DUF1778 family)